MVIRGGMGIITFWALAIALLPVKVFSEATFDKLISAGSYKEAIDYADEKLPTSDRTAEDWMKLARANDELGMVEKALACYLVSWRMNPNDYQSLLGAAQVYNKLNQPENAMNMAQKALEKNFTAEASWEYARSCILLNRSADAKKALEKVIEADSSNVIANRELGNIYFDEAAYIKAIPLLKRAFKDKADGEVSFRIGKSYVEIGVADSALSYLKDAVNRKVKVSEASQFIARAHYGLKNYAEASAGFDKVQSSMMAATDYFMSAVSKEKTNNAPGALEAYQSAVAAFGADKGKESLLAREKVARSHMAKSAFQAALPLLQFIVDADEKGSVVPDIHFMLADVYQGINNGQQAIASLEKAISLNPRNVEAYARLADLYEKNGLAEKAKRTYEAMMSLSPNDPAVYLALGQYNLKGKRYSEALGHFEKADGLRKTASSSEGVAVSAFNLNDVPKAREAAKAAVAMDANAWEARVVLAKAYVKEENYKAAQEHAEFLVKKESQTLEYLGLLSKCYEENGEKDKLAENDRKIVALDRKDLVSRQRLARYADTKNDAETALTMYKEISDLDQKNSNALYRLYDLSNKKGNKAEAVSYLKKFLVLSPNDGEAQRDLGDLLYEQKDYDGALTAYRAAIKINPAIKGFYKRYAEIVIAKGQQDEVINALSGVIKTGEADFGTYTTLGMIYQKKAQHAKAIEMYTKALQIDPQNLDALTALGASQAAGGDLNGAIISYEQAVMMNSQAGVEYKELGDLYTKQKKIDEAMKAYKKYLDKVPDDQVAARRVGQFSLEKGQYADAAKYFGLVKSSDAEFLLMYADACIKANLHKDAISPLENLKGRKPRISSYSKVVKMLAESYEKSGNEAAAAAAYAELVTIPGVKDGDAAHKAALLHEKSNPALAQKIYEDNVKNYPGDYRNFLRLGLIYSDKKDLLPKAIPLLQKCTGIADSLPVVWLELAKVYGKLGKEADELQAYQNYAQKDPQNLEANRRIGIILMRKGDVSNALVYLEIANTLSPNDPSVMAMLAKGYIKTKRTNEAIDLLNRAKAAKKDDPEVRYQLFELYQSTGQPVKALEEIKSLVEMKKTPQYLLLYGEALLVQNKLKDAENVVDELMAEDPENVDVLMFNARILRARKKYDDAVKVYKEVTRIMPFAPALYECAETYMLLSKPIWAETFYKRAIQSDPNYALAHLGMAKLAKSRKQMELYKESLETARKLDPDNEQIQAELRSK